jgi:hypothetical protein
MRFLRYVGIYRSDMLPFSASRGEVPLPLAGAAPQLKAAPDGTHPAQRPR